VSNGGTIAFTLNFETPQVPDHFKFYGVDEETAPYIGKDVELVDQFGAINATVGYAISFGNPVQKIHNDDVTPISDPNRHLTIYDLEYEGEERRPEWWWQVEVKNQFGESQQLTVTGPFWLAVPTQKEGHEEPVCLNHYLLYQVIEGPYVGVEVDLKDQFTEGAVVVGWPQIFANPVQKTYDGKVTEIENPDEHLVFYALGVGDFEKKEVQIVNQFGPQTLDLHEEEMALLGVPSEKISWEQEQPLLLDHFTCYPAAGTALEGEVRLVDQWVDITTMVIDPVFFCNPAKKWYEGLTPILSPDFHLMVYNLAYQDWSEWSVTVDNQFGPDQVLTVYGPVALAVPTWKQYPGEHFPPIGLDHFLLYEVVGGQPLGVSVGLWGQFIEGEPMGVNVGIPRYFANPVQKTYDGKVTEIENPEAHLVFYDILGSQISVSYVQVWNQLLDEPAYYDLGPEANMLAVPSAKIAWQPGD